jgi:ATP-binding cassette subfamily F protein 3
MHVYHGNYEKYVQQKEERRATLMAAYKNQRDRIEALEAFINRFRYQATKAKQVQSRIKELEKIERIEVPEEEATIHFTIPQPPASGRTVIEVSHLSKDYPMPDVDGKPGGVKHVLEDLNFQIERGERVALVGANGAGKSTLIRLLSGLEPATSGTVRLGHNVLADYFAQDQYKVLDPDAQMLDDISGIAPKVPVVELRSLLGCFMFSGDDVFKKLGVLSGGERNRYAMAKMLVSPANMLLLDEPTNHLDLRAKDVLLEAIANFTGTVLFVSHDRYFIDGLATRVFEVEDRRVHIYPGNYEDYLWRKQGGPEQVAVSLATSLKPAHAHAASAVVPSEPSEQDGPGESDLADTSSAESAQPSKAPIKRLNPIKLKQLEDRVALIEGELSAVDARVAAAEEHLGHYTSAEDSQRTAGELDELRSLRTALMAEWESLASTLEEQSTAV